MKNRAFAISFLPAAVSGLSRPCAAGVLVASLVGVVFLAGCGGSLGSAAGRSASCPRRTLDRANTVAEKRGAVVRVISDVGAGSGFILSEPGASGRWLIATNYHVVAEGSTFGAEILSHSGESVRLADLQVAKIDAVNDLALLEAPPISDAEGIALASGTPVEGQDILVLGFPFVAQSRSMLTAEPGSVTATNRQFEGGLAVHQVSANVHPGNSGGPVLDSCGRAVGVVVSKARGMEGVNFVVPSEALVELVAAYRAPRRPAELAVKRSLESFFEDLGYADPLASAAHFSRTYLNEQVLPLLVQELDELPALIARVESQTGVRLRDQQLTEAVSLLGRFGGPTAPAAYVAAVSLAAGGGDQYEAMRVYLSSYLQLLFGEGDDYVVDTVRTEGRNTAEAIVRFHGRRAHGRLSRWRFRFRYEWGDWQIVAMDPTS